MSLLCDGTNFIQSNCLTHTVGLSPGSMERQNEGNHAKVLKRTKVQSCSLLRNNALYCFACFSGLLVLAHYLARRPVALRRDRRRCAENSGIFWKPVVSSGNFWKFGSTVSGKRLNVCICSDTSASKRGRGHGRDNALTTLVLPAFKNGYMF